MNTWTQGTNFPIRTDYGEGAVIGGKLYTFGGPVAPHSTHAKVNVYDACSNTWKASADMPSIRTGQSTSVVKGEAYMGGGVTFLDV